MIEKQKVVIDELRHKLDLDLKNFDVLSTDELRQVVDHAIGQVSPFVLYNIYNKILFFSEDL